MLGTGSRLRPSVFAVVQKFIDSGNYVQTEYRGVDTLTMAQKNATLEMMEREMVTRLSWVLRWMSSTSFVDSWKLLAAATR